MAESIRVGNVEIQLLQEGKQFLGLGEIRIGDVVVRSGDLPMRPYSVTVGGIEYDRFELDRIVEEDGRVVLHPRAIGVAAPVAPMLDHSLDPVWSTRAWDRRPIAEDGMEWILEPQSRTVSGREYTGFTYQYRFRSAKNRLYYIMDRATWELDGDAVGVTVLRQQSGGDPKVTFRRSTPYTTSAIIGYPLNPDMTHDLPRWASEQGFDYQYRGGTALIGMFDGCGLIRTIVAREPGEPCICHLDKQIFDETGSARTITKFIGIARGVGNDTDHMNAWTGVFDADQDNVLREFGMVRTYPKTTLSHNFWNNFTADSYRAELLPAAAALGFQQVFIDPFWENDMTREREGSLPKYLSGNMCCPHEYEVGNVLGGIEAYRKLADDAKAEGIDLISWIGSHQSVHSPYLNAHQDQIIRLADGRHWYGSGYNTILGMDHTTGFGDMFEESAIRAKDATGISGYLYDSFYNFGWMPVNFYSPDPAKPGKFDAGHLKPHTQWKRLAKIMAAWQKAGLHMLIESLGPWGQPQHGVQGAYNAPGCEPLAYQCSVNVGYSIIPTASSSAGRSSTGPDLYYRLLANKAPTTFNLWVAQPDGTSARIDRVCSPIIRQANLDYRAVRQNMHTRTLLQNDAGVLWTPMKGKRNVLFSYKDQSFRVAPGTPYVDQTTGEKGIASKAGIPALQFHTYLIG